MIAALRNEETSIGVVRIRGTSGNALSDRQQVAALLRRTSLRGHALPPSSVLCVRKMRDPLPGLDWFQQRNLRVPAEWEEQAARQLDSFASAALRPAQGFVPATAESVLFLDRAELLACLATDWAHGWMRANWWWASFIGSRDVNSVVEREWKAAPAYVPLALDLLVRWGGAANFLQRLTDENAEALLTAMRQTFAIAEGRSANPVKRSIRSSEDAGSREEESPSGSEESAAVAEPWLPWLPEMADLVLSPIKRAFLGQAIMLRRAPAVVRSAAFQTHVALWIEAASVLQRGATFASQPFSGARRSSRRLKSEQPAIGVGISDFADECERSDLGTAGSEDRNALLAGETKSPNFVAEAVDWNELAVDRGDPAALPSPTPGSRVAAGEQTETAVGGVFFLLNVATQLGLYGDFCSPQHKGLDLDIWDFLTLIGTACVGGQESCDPVWNVLADLACRNEGESAGTYFDAPLNWRVPEDWLEAFPEEFERVATTQGGRVRTWHPSGFLLVDEGPDEGLSQAVRLERWVGWMTGYLRARLVRALGREDATECLIHLPARVQQTANHLQVWFSLDRYPIEIRLAGLDRDPGWIPAAARYVAYRFE